MVAKFEAAMSVQHLWSQEAVSVLFVSLLAFFAVMPDAPFIDVLYELTSAVGTDRLSRGLTSVLNTPAKWIVILPCTLEESVR